MKLSCVKFGINRLSDTKTQRGLIGDIIHQSAWKIKLYAQQNGQNLQKLKWW